MSNHQKRCPNDGTILVRQQSEAYLTDTLCCPQCHGEFFYGVEPPTSEEVERPVNALFESRYKEVSRSTLKDIVELSESLNYQDNKNLLPDQVTSFDQYQVAARRTAIYPGDTAFYRLNYCVHGLAGEAGEVSNQFKKALRDDSGALTYERKRKIIGELGDVLWYLSQCCSELNISLEGVAQHNLEKLAQRALKNELKGDKRE